MQKPGTDCSSVCCVWWSRCPKMKDERDKSNKLGSEKMICKRCGANIQANRGSVCPNCSYPL